MWWLLSWTIANLVIAALFLTVVTLNGAPVDEWLLFVILAALPWVIRSIWKQVTQ